MTIPCENREELLEIRKAISSMGVNGNKLEDALLRMAKAHEKQTEELREMTHTITTHMIDNREFRVNLERAKEERDHLFSMARKSEAGDIHLTALVHNQEVKNTEMRAAVKGIGEILAPLPTRLHKVELSYNRLMGGIVIIPSILTFLSFCFVVYSALKEG